MERPPAPRPVVPATQNTATSNVVDAADSDELPLVLRWAERFFSTWHYPTATAVAALVIWYCSLGAARASELTPL